MIRKSAGDSSSEFYEGGWPHYVALKVKGTEIRNLIIDDLRDLQYVVNETIRALEQAGK